VKFITLILLTFLISLLCISCKKKEISTFYENISEETGYVFKNNYWGISVIFPDQYAHFKRSQEFIYFGKKINWPFYDKIHPYKMYYTAFETKKVLLKNLKKIVPNRQVQIIKSYRIRNFDIVHYKYSEIYFQCPAIRFELVGKKHNYVFEYPDCGGIVNDAFHREAERYILSVIRTAQFID